jgi:hypothetical protein
MAYMVEDPYGNNTHELTIVARHLGNLIARLYSSYVAPYDSIHYQLIGMPVYSIWNYL